uniref:Uncharacterized protein n=1 Tax=Methylophaga nitratireducenticrescens TaxID=754476 RepID=I1XLM1_METNJ
MRPTRQLYICENLRNLRINIYQHSVISGLLSKAGITANKKARVAMQTGL